MAKTKYTDKYIRYLIEDTHTKVCGLLESVILLHDSLIDTDRRLERIQEQTALLKAMSEAIKDTGKILKNHKDRLVSLESKV